MRILVVEDEHKIANSIKKGLAQEGFAVDVAYDGTEGYDLASSEEYDVVILDIMLPGMDGVTICKKLRQEKNHTPILMLTAKGQIQDKVQGLNSGADDYVVKPFAFEELSLLEYLMRNPGKIINKDQIIAHVWDYDSDVLPNTVEVYIGYLRQKIDRGFPGKKPLIQTIRGFGYKVESN